MGVVPEGEAPGRLLEAEATHAGSGFLGQRHLRGDVPRFQRCGPVEPLEALAVEGQQRLLKMALAIQVEFGRHDDGRARGGQY